MFSGTGATPDPYPARCAAVTNRTVLSAIHSTGAVAIRLSTAR